MTTELDLMRPMSDTQRVLFQTEMLKHRKSVGVAAILCLLLGLVGGHRFYLSHIGMGLLYAFTVGLFFVGALIDLLRIRSLVDSVNMAKAREVAAQIISLDDSGTAAAMDESARPSLARRLGRRFGSRRAR